MTRPERPVNLECLPVTRVFWSILFCLLAVLGGYASLRAQSAQKPVPPLLSDSLVGPDLGKVRVENLVKYVESIQVR
jgi:hypothetical protein